MATRVYINTATSKLYLGFIVIVVGLCTKQVDSAALKNEFVSIDVAGVLGTVQNGAKEDAPNPALVGKTERRRRQAEERVYGESGRELKLRSLFSTDFGGVRKWQSGKRHIQRRNFASTDSVVFVDIPRNDQQRDKRSYAVKPPPAKMEADSVQVALLSVASVAVLIVVVFACLHMPCYCLKGRYKSDLDLDLIGCPNPTAHDGKCGKCLFDRASRKLTRKSKFFSRDKTPVSTGTNEELFLASESMYSAQPPWMSDFGMGSTTELPKPKKKSRSIVQAILRRSRSRDKFRYEFLAAKYGYNYPNYHHPENKRSSVYDDNEPDWYSAGEFLNRQSRYRTQRSYGSTDPGKSCTHGCFKFSSKSENQTVEDILKSKPRRRQVVELQEFPIGFSAENYHGDEKGYRDKGVVYDPCQQSQMKRSESGPCYHSESNLESYFSQFDKSSKKRNSCDESRSSRKSSMKSEGSSPRSSAKLVHFYPSSFNYETSFIQGTGTGGKYQCEKHRHLVQKEDPDPHTEEDTSSSDLMSFDEDEDNGDGLFDYSPHMVHYRQCNNPYQKHLQGFNSYAEMPQYSYYTNPYTRIKRTVRSETELRRAKETPFAAQPPHKTPLKSRRPVSCSDTTLNRTHILRELTSVGLAKPSRRKSAKSIPRDARIDPLVGKISPMVKPKHCDKQRSSKSLNEKCTVVKMPEISCKEVILREEMKEKATLPREEQVDEGSTLDYKHVPCDVDPKYLTKGTHLQDEPVRDTDSDDPSESLAHNISSSVGTTDIKYQSSLVHCHDSGLESKTREDLLITSPQPSS